MRAATVAWPTLRSATKDRVLDSWEITSAVSKLGWHVAMASRPGSWEPPAGAKASLLLLVVSELPAALACIEGLRGRGAPIIALLLDAATAPLPCVLDGQRSLVACGAGDVVQNVASREALEVAIAMGSARCERHLVYTRHTTAEDPEARPAQTDSLGFSDLSDWFSDPGAVAEERWERRAVAEVGVNTDIAMQSGCLRCARCARPPPAPQPGRRHGGRKVCHGRPPAHFDGVWVAAHVHGGAAGAMSDVNKWLRRLAIRGSIAMLGDGTTATLQNVGGCWRLNGGELELIGDALVRHGNSGLAIEFHRQRDGAPYDAPGDQPR